MPTVQQKARVKYLSQGHACILTIYKVVSEFLTNVLLHPVKILFFHMRGLTKRRDIKSRITYRRML